MSPLALHFVAPAAYVPPAASSLALPQLRASRPAPLWTPRGRPLAAQIGDGGASQFDLGLQQGDAEAADLIPPINMKLAATPSAAPLSNPSAPPTGFTQLPPLQSAPGGADLQEGSNLGPPPAGADIVGGSAKEPTGGDGELVELAPATDSIESVLDGVPPAPNVPPEPLEFTVVPADGAAKAEDEVPTLRELAVFVIPTLGIWLSSPLLSLIDTSVVGCASGVKQLAALAPSTKLCDYVGFYCTVISAATTNLAAEQLALDKSSKAKQIIGSSLYVAIVMGIGVAAVVNLFARPAMVALLGRAADPTVLSAATGYTALRALGYPACLLTMALQAAFVASKDTRTPLLAVPVAAVVNLIADLVLVGPLGMGAAGAAIATVGSQVASAGMLLFLWARKAKTVGSTDEPLIKTPSREELTNLASFAAPMLIALTARVYMGLSITLSAVTLGTCALAGNQVIESLYWLFCPVGDGFSLCMQAFLPPLLLRGRHLARKLQKMALWATVGSGVLVFASATALPTWAPWLFTTSAPVALVLRKAAPANAASIVAYMIATCTEGMLLARKKLRFLSTMHVFNSIAFVVFLKTCVNKLPNCGLHHVWWAVAFFNTARTLEFLWGVRRDDQVQAAEDSAWKRRRALHPAWVCEVCPFDQEVYIEHHTWVDS